MATSKIIPEKAIQKAKRRGACREALDWLSEKPRTFQALVRYAPEWADWACMNLLNKKKRAQYNSTDLALYDRRKSTRGYMIQWHGLLLETLETNLG